MAMPANERDEEPVVASSAGAAVPSAAVGGDVAASGATLAGETVSAAVVGGWVA
jgi:hypothetical protein